MWVKVAEQFNGLAQLQTADTQNCALIQTKINEIIDKIYEKDSILKADSSNSRLRILDWIRQVVYSNEQKISLIIGRAPKFRTIPIESTYWFYVNY